MSYRIISFGPIESKLGEVHRLTVPLPKIEGGLVRPHRLIATQGEGHFIIRDIRVDDRPQLADENAKLPAAAFSAEAVQTSLALEDGHTDMTLVVERVPLPPPTRWQKILVFLHLRKKRVEPEKATFSAAVMAECYDPREPAPAPLSALDRAFYDVAAVIEDYEDELSTEEFLDLLERLGDKIKDFYVERS